MQGNNLYEFGEFRLDPREKILARGGTPVELTPKGFELLSFLVENCGRLLSKEELMKKVWADSFVEESNLTFNIRQLRVILGDDAHDPKYIKTVRRHGYRFIADVRLIAGEERPDPSGGHFPQSTPAAAAKESPERRETRLFSAPVLVFCVILMAVVIGIGVWYAQNGKTNVPVLAAGFGSEKLSNTGKVSHAVLSPNGRIVIYVSGKGDGKQSIWLRQLEDDSNIEIVPPSEDIYSGLSISPDGGTLYFARRPRATAEPTNIYRIPVAGGIPQKILSATEGFMSISPDSRRISFVRCPWRDDESCSLWTADAANGANERKMVSRQKPFRIGDNRFSPDGKSIAFVVGQSATAADQVGLSEIDAETGQEREFSGEKFTLIGRIAWLPDKSGLLVTASRGPNIGSRIWKVSAGGEAVPLANDAESYSALSLDEAATKLVSTQIKWEFHVRLLNIENPSEIRVLTDGYTAAYAPDGTIYFSSAMSGSAEIWSIQPDGSSRRQLTNNRAAILEPIVTPDGSAVIFASNQSGSAQIWRMNRDGSDQKQVTRENGGLPIFASPDGEWIYYIHSLEQTLWRVQLKTGAQQMVLNKSKDFFAVSPDAARVAYSEQQGDAKVLAIAALEDGKTLRTFPLADGKNLLQQIGWLPDGKNLAYISASREKTGNVLWLQPLDGGNPRQIAALGDDVMNGLNLPIAPDGKSFAIVQGVWRRDAVLLKGLR